MRHVSTRAHPEYTCTYCQVVDSHATQGPAVVAEVVLNGWISHLGKGDTRVDIQTFTPNIFGGDAKLNQLNSSVVKLRM